MSDKLSLETIVSDLYKQITSHSHSKTPEEYNLFHRKVRIAFAENHSLHETALNASEKVLIPLEDAPTERLEILMRLGVIPRNFYFLTLKDC